MKVLVTGANGFLASNIIRELLTRNIEVRGMVRHNCNEKSLEGITIELSKGNIVNYSDVSNAVKGCDVVIHAAADTSQYSASPLPLFPVNVKGTDNILKAMKQHGVRRLIFVSTANTIGLDTYQTDTSPGKLTKYYMRSGYALSKQKAEHLIMNEVNAGRLDAVIVNPTFMIGPHDAKPSSGRIFMLFLKNRVVFYPPGGKNFIDVKSAAIAICNAIDRGQNGVRYNLSGVNLTFREFLQRVDLLEKRRSIGIKIPGFLLTAAGAIGSVLRTTGLKVELNYYNARILCQEEDIPGDKAKQDLLMPDTDIDSAIQGAVDWFRKNGYLHKK